MVRSFFRSVGFVLSLLSLTTAASAGSLAEGVADPAVEDLVIEEEASSSIGILPIVALLVVVALVASSSSSSSKKKEPPS